MTNYYVKERITDGKAVKLSSVENGNQIAIIMFYPNGYIQMMSYPDFSSKLAMLRQFSDNDVIKAVQKEFDYAISNPCLSVNQIGERRK